jgi:thymidylate synthase (FAD)
LERTVVILGNGFVEFQDQMGDDQCVADAARVSKLGESKGEESDRKLIHYLMKHGHSTPFEQVELKFRIKCPLFVRSQIMRHRTFSYNEMSRRYTSENIDFYIPEYFRKQAETNKQSSLEDSKIEYIIDDIPLMPPQPVKEFVKKIAEDACYNYYLMLDNGVSREQARMVLPINMNTMFIMKGNLKNWFHFLGLRTREDAQWETRQVAIAVENFIMDSVPCCYEAWALYRKDKE